MTTAFIILALIAAGLAFLEFKKPGTVKGWVESVKKLTQKEPPK